MSDITREQIMEMMELEKKVAEAPWLVQDDSGITILCMTTNDGQPYLGTVGGVGHYDTRDFIIALRNAAPDLFRLALYGLAAKRMVEALVTISKGEGRFSRDPLTHADNTIEDMKKVATDALAAYEEMKPNDNS